MSRHAKSLQAWACEGMPTLRGFSADRQAREVVSRREGVRLKGISHPKTRLILSLSKDDPEGAGPDILRRAQDEVEVGRICPLPACRCPLPQEEEIFFLILSLSKDDPEGAGPSILRQAQDEVGDGGLERLGRCLSPVCEGTPTLRSFSARERMRFLTPRQTCLSVSSPSS